MIDKYSPLILVMLVYLSLFLDNVLLTVVVPIIPDYLCSIAGNSTSDQNERVGLLLSSKALVQLIFNPAVGSLTETFGYSKPFFIGNLTLLISSLLFAFGQTYEFLFLARSIQGMSSACIGVSGMSLVASQYPYDAERSKVMGFVLGSIALGVLVGYPIGAILYDIEGKMAPFLLISSLIMIPINIQLFIIDIDSINPKVLNTSESIKNNWIQILSDQKILLISGAILTTTSPMAILETCLPIWLRTTIKPQKWQLGTVFIPDSIGYLIGTNCFGMIAYKYGRCKTAVMAIILIGINIILLPSATTMQQLIIPHLGVGLGIGIVDAALVPLLASLVNQNSNFGPVYSTQQMAVSLAYFFGPIIGSELVKNIGFKYLMLLVGIINLIYSFILIYFIIRENNTKSNINNYNNNNNNSSNIVSRMISKTENREYERFNDSSDDDL